MIKVPDISVLMAIYNGADTLHEAIESILNQSFQNFEFIIVDDGSNDNTSNILSKYADADARIKIITQKNTGLTRALNNGLKQCTAPLIARQDSDDISYPERLRRQYDYMNDIQNKDVVLLGGACDDEHIDGTKSIWRCHSGQDIKNIIYIKSPFAHSTVMFRSGIAKQLGGYDTAYKTAQDMEFWMRLHKVGRVAMLSEPILLRRINKESISAKRKWRQFFDSSRARLKHAPWFKLKIRAFCYSAIIGILSVLPLSLKNKVVRILRRRIKKP